MEARRRLKADKSGEETWQRLGCSSCNGSQLNKSAVLSPMGRRHGGSCQLEMTPTEDLDLNEAVQQLGKECCIDSSVLVPGRPFEKV
jgi:hypothetical protein